MSSAATTIELKSLLEHIGWVRSLANQLVRDPELAADLTQETMLAAIEARGAPVRSPRAWLGRVLRNILWERVRGENRRNRREAAVAREDAEPSSADLVERVDAHRTVVNAVMSLPEHYRLIVLRRYYLDETPTAIAAALAMPIATVKTRLQRGLEQLRGELDRKYGGSEQRNKALLPLLPVTGAKSPLMIGAAAALVLLSGGLLAWASIDWSAEPLAPGRGQAFLAGGGAAAVSPIVDPGSALAAREAASVQTEAPIDWHAVKMPPRELAGAAWFADGRPAGSLLLEFVHDRERAAEHAAGTKIAISEADGAFRLAVSGSGEVRSGAADHVTVLAGRVAAADLPSDLCVVVAAARTFAGLVVDPAGNPLGDAVVEVLPPTDLRGRFGPRVSDASTTRFVTTTTADGRFAFALVPALDGASVVVRREGYALYRGQLPAEADCEIALAAPAHTAGDIVGQVVGPDGAAVFEARVSCGGAVTRSGRDGGFRLPRPVAGATTRLIAARPGMQPALLEHATGHQGAIVLRLGGVLRTIRGRVVRADGAPVVDGRVWFVDPTLFAHTPGVSHSRTTSGFDSMSIRPDQPTTQWQHPEILEEYFDGVGTPWHPAATDAEGRFVLTGLLDRDYHVRAGDPVSLQVTGPHVVAAGAADLELTLPANVHDKIHGRCLDRQGRPVPRVHIALQLRICDLRDGDRPVIGLLHRNGAMVTGPDGEFWLYDVPAQGVDVQFSGAGLLSRLLTVNELLAAPQIELQRTASLWVRSLDPAAIDSIAVVDAAGRPISVQVRRGNEQQNSRRLPLDRGRSEAFVLPDTAVAVVAYRGDVEVRRQPVPAGGGELEF